MSVFLEEISIWINRLSKESLPSPMWACIIQSAEGPNRTKKVKEEWILIVSFWARMSDIVASGFQALQTLGLTPAVPQFSSLWPETGSYTTDSPSIQAFGLGLNYTTGFPGSPVCRRQIVGLILLNQWANFYTKSLLIYNYISIKKMYSFCFFQRTLIQSHH